MPKVIGKTFPTKRGKNATQNPPKKNATPNAEAPKAGNPNPPVKEEK